MNPEQVQRDLNEIYRGWIRRDQASFFGSRLQIAETAASASSITVNSDFKWPTPTAGDVEVGVKSPLAQAA